MIKLTYQLCTALHCTSVHRISEQCSATQSTAFNPDEMFAVCSGQCSLRIVQCSEFTEERAE